jgi:hypothetical protein
MKANGSKLLLVAVVMACSSQAWASERCTTVPKEKWLAEKDIRARIEGQGYKIERIKLDDDCYEVRARNRDGHRVELEVDPGNGDISEEDDS